MLKTFCDVCGAELPNVDIRRYKVFDNNKAVDLCEDHYSMLVKLLIGQLDEKVSVDGEQ